jgi:hypothetical protein
MNRVAIFFASYVTIVAALLISPMVALFVVFIAVSLLVSTPQRHHPAAVGAGTGAAVGGTASGSPIYSPKRPAVTASATG